jgi:hypothetical protein
MATVMIVIVKMVTAVETVIVMMATVEKNIIVMMVTVMQAMVLMRMNALSPIKRLVRSYNICVMMKMMEAIL